MKLTFWGATETVTGSKYLLEFDGKKVLIDCGLFQGKKELRERNWQKPGFDPKKIDAILLTHAHIDHSGYIPLLVKEGFKGPIICTAATKDLCSILLPDSGYLQEEAANFANRYGFSKHHPALPLYTREEAENCLSLFKTKPFGERFTILGSLIVQFNRVGHILGASSIFIEHEGTSIIFSGDVGRFHDPIMRAPVEIQKADYLVIESTYGDRAHETRDPKDHLEEIIRRVVDRNGTIVIPTFAVGRAQMILYYVSQLMDENKIPHIPVFLDSPLSTKATDIFYQYMNEHRLSREDCRKMQAITIPSPTIMESKAIDETPGSKIIISASGMATGGRVLHHIKYFASDPNNAILFTGFQVEGTRGKRLLNGEETIKMFGELIPVHAEVINLVNSSAHADSEEILEWLSHMSAPPRMTFITHGELPASKSFEEKITDKLGWPCVVPEYQQEFEL